MTVLARRAALLLPFGAAVLAGAGFFRVLGRMEQGTFDPHTLPSQLIGKPVPDFNLPGLADSQGFASTDLHAPGRPMLVNFFASWCVPCVIEAPELLALAKDGLPIWAVAYKDKPTDAAGFLARHGNPYARIAADTDGRAAIEWGVYGVPETYLIDATGTVRWRQAGPVTKEVAEDQLRPLLRHLT